jgi:hypothetical protein
VAIAANRARVERGPARLLAELRARGSARRARDASGRQALRRIIAFVDRCFPSGENCYRRVLIEIAMDAGAASEPLHLGLRAHGGKDSGHAWLGVASGRVGNYDAEFVV